MADANEPKAQNDKGGEETTPGTPPVSESKATEESVNPDKGKPEETEGSESKPSKKGAEARIQKLSRRAKKAEGESKSLADKLEEVTSQFGNQVASTPAQAPAVETPIVQPGEEIDTVEFEKRMNARDSRLLKQAKDIAVFHSNVDRVVNNINKEAKEVISEYPELDPNSEVFNQDLSEAITEATEAQVKGNPTASVKKLVSKLMKPYKRAVTEQVGKETENLAKQVSKSALRPTPSPKGETDFEDKSIAEMEKELGTIR